MQHGKITSFSPSINFGKRSTFLGENGETDTKVDTRDNDFPLPQLPGDRPLPRPMKNVLGVAWKASFQTNIGAGVVLPERAS